MGASARTFARTSRRTPRAGIRSAVAAAVLLRSVCRGKPRLQLLACTDVPAYTNATGWTGCLSSLEHCLYRPRCLHSDHFDVVILPGTSITAALSVQSKVSSFRSPLCCQCALGSVSRTEATETATANRNLRAQQKK